MVVPLSFAAFFENYDYALLSIAAPVLSAGLGVSSSKFGVAVSIIRISGLAAILFVRVADRVGRRRMLLLTLTGLAVATGLTSLAWGLISFVIISSMGRMFLTAEGAMSGLVISEEVDPARRGQAVSFAGLLGQTGFGAVAVLIVIVPHVPGGWRLLYLLALGPLLVAARLRRQLPETEAFQVAVDDERVQHERRFRVPRQWWTRLAVCTMVFGAVGAFQTAAAYHSAQLAQHTYHWTGIYTLIIVGSGPFTLVGFLLGGRGSDRWGRRPLLTFGILVEGVGMAVLFLAGRAWFAPGWLGFVVGQAAVAGCWLAYVSELVPTEVRATVISIVVSVQVAAGSAGLAISSLLGDSPIASGRIVVWLAALSALISLGLWAIPEPRGRDVIAAY